MSLAGSSTKVSASLWVALSTWPSLARVSISIFFPMHSSLLNDNMITVEPPNKGHVGDNINSAVVSFVERLSSFGGSECFRNIIGKQFWGP